MDLDGRQLLWIESINSSFVLEFEWGPSSDMFLALFNPVRSNSVDLSVYINTYSTIFYYYFLGLFITNAKTQWRFLIEYYQSWAEMGLIFKVSLL